MKIEKNIVSTGYWLFRWRSYFPIFLLIIFVPAMAGYEYVGGNREMTTNWGIFSMVVGLLGCCVAVFLSCCPAVLPS